MEEWAYSQIVSTIRTVPRSTDANLQQNENDNLHMTYIAFDASSAIHESGRHSRHHEKRSDTHRSAVDLTNKQEAYGHCLSIY